MPFCRRRDDVRLAPERRAANKYDFLSFDGLSQIVLKISMTSVLMLITVPNFHNLSRLFVHEAPSFHEDTQRFFDFGLRVDALGHYATAHRADVTQPETSKR
jgi:hypothetical protein